MPSKDTYKVFREFVQGLTTLSKCKDKQVACLICDERLQQIYSVGINGGPSGVQEDMECLCSTETKYSCIHAEANALVKLTAHVPDKVMICSLAPCTQCASLIINELGGFGTVLYLEPWKEPMALQLLISNGIRVGQLLPDGTIDWVYNGWGLLEALDCLKNSAK